MPSHRQGKAASSADAKSTWATPGKCTPQEQCPSNTLFSNLNILNGQLILAEYLQRYLIVKDKLKLELSSCWRTIHLGSE